MSELADELAEKVRLAREKREREKADRNAAIEATASTIDTPAEVIPAESVEVSDESLSVDAVSVPPAQPVEALIAADDFLKQLDEKYGEPLVASSIGAIIYTGYVSDAREKELNAQGIFFADKTGRAVIEQIEEKGVLNPNELSRKGLGVTAVRTGLSSLARHNILPQYQSQFGIHDPLANPPTDETQRADAVSEMKADEYTFDLTQYAHIKKASLNQYKILERLVNSTGFCVDLERKIMGTQAKDSEISPQFKSYYKKVLQNKTDFKILTNLAPDTDLTNLEASLDNAIEVLPTDAPVDIDADAGVDNYDIQAFLEKPVRAKKLFKCELAYRAFRKLATKCEDVRYDSNTKEIITTSKASKVGSYYARTIIAKTLGINRIRVRVKDKKILEETLSGDAVSSLYKKYYNEFSNTYGECLEFKTGDKQIAVFKSGGSSKWKNTEAGEGCGIYVVSDTAFKTMKVAIAAGEYRTAKMLKKDPSISRFSVNSCRTALLKRGIFDTFKQYLAMPPTVEQTEDMSSTLDDNLEVIPPDQEMYNPQLQAVRLQIATTLNNHLLSLNKKLSSPEAKKIVGGIYKAAEEILFKS